MSIIHFRAFLQRALFAVIAVACAIVITVTPAKSQKHIEDLDIFDLILQIKRGSLTLSEGIVALQQDESYYLPISEIARLVEFPVNIDLEANIIEGWFLKEENTFRIDLEQSIYTRGGKVAQPYSPGDVIIERRIGNLSEVYVNVDLLNSIWPLNIDINFSRMRMDIKTPLRLPYEARQDRQSAREAMLVDRAGDLIDVAALEYLDNPYRMFTKPIINLDTNHDYSKNAGARGRVNAAIQHELLGFTANYRLNLGYTEDDLITPKTLRLRMNRQDYDGKPMVLGLRRITFGDVSSAANPLIATSQSGRGIQVSSRPSRTEVTFDHVTISGLATPGYELELYQNNQLIDFGYVPEDGEYKFEDLVLVSGNNVFRTVIYGPQGQTEERVESHNVARQIAEPGSFEYNLNVVDVDQTFLPFDNSEDRVNEASGIAYSASVKYGLRRWISLFGETSRVVQHDRTDNYISAGANFFGLGGSGRAEVLKQIGGGHALNLRYVRSIAGWGGNIQSTLYSDFESQRAGEDETAKRFDFRGIATRTFNVPFGSLGLRFSLDHERDVNGYRFTRFGARQSLGIKGLRLNNNIHTIFPYNSDRQISGTLDANYRISRRWSLRSRLGYKVDPEYNLENFQTSLRYRGKDKYTAALSLTRDLDTAETGIGLQLGKDFDHFSGSLNTDWNSDSGMSLSLRATTSLAPFGEDDSYIASSRSFASSNALQARIYKDNDSDGEYSEGDELLDDGKITVDGVVYDDTAENGYLILQNAAQHGDAVIQFKQYSTENPFLMATTPGYNALLRPGTVQKVDFPLVESGAIDGMAFFENGTPVPGLRVELVNESGEVVNTTITAFDGFYTFEFVRPGEYIIRADASQQVFVPPRSVSVTSEEIFVYGVDLVILEQTEEVLTSALTEAETGKVAQPYQNAQLAGEGTNVSAPSIGGRPAFKSLAIDEDDLSSELGEAAQIDSPLRAEKGEVAQTKPNARTVIDAKSPASDKGRDLRNTVDPVSGGEDTQTLKMDDVDDVRTDHRAEKGEVAQTKPDVLAGAASFASSSLTSTDGKPAVINQVRIGEYLDDMRIILDLSGPADYRISTEEGGEEIILFLPHTKWFAGQDTWIFEHGSILAKIEGKTLEDGGSVLRILSADRIQLKDVFVVRPTKRGDYELTIELGRLP